jgi:hypothetical protein
MQAKRAAGIPRRVQFRVHVGLHVRARVSSATRAMHAGSARLAHPEHEAPAMDDRDNTGSPDRDLISLEQDHEIRYWTEKFNVTEALLRRAVAQVGHSAAAVERFVRRG